MKTSRTRKLIALLMIFMLMVTALLPLTAAETAAASLTITAQPKDFAGSVGDTATFKVAASGSGLTYQWQFLNVGKKNFSNSSQTGSRTATISVPVTSARIGQQYRCVVTDSSGNTVTSAAASIVSAVSGITITQQPTSVTAAVDTTASFTVKASGSGLTYQWQYRASEKSSWYNSSSSTEGYHSATLKVVAATRRNGYQYRCVVKDSSGGTATSNAAMLTVGEASSSLKITSQPKSVTAAEGETASFTISATGSSLTYQWQYRASEKSAWYNNSSSTSGYHSPTVSIPVIARRNGYQYRCVVTDSTGTSLASEAAMLTVGEAQAEGVVITSQPSSVTAAVGTTASFTVAASGNGLTYQWQYRASDKSAWYNSSSSTVGYNSTTLKVSVIERRNGYQYRCIVKDGNGNQAESEAAMLTVGEDGGSELVITKQPEDVTSSVGDYVSYTVSAKGDGLRYQWQYCNAGKTTWNNSSQTGSKTATLTVEATAARSGQRYRCIITDSTGDSITSEVVTITFAQKLSITKQPIDYAGEAGETASFTVTATGSGIIYQWQYCAKNSTAWKTSTLSGNKTATLNVQITSARDGQMYRCVVKDKNGDTETSTAATLHLLAGEEDYDIIYHLNDDYLDSVGVDNSANPTGYSTSKIPSGGLKLNDLHTEGYYFLGWYDGAGSNANQVKVIPEGASGDKEFYAHWQQRSYTVLFDSPINTIASKTYTVDTGLTLQDPTWFGYTFVAWTDEDENVVTRIEKGTTGNKILKANWTSQRFQTRTKALSAPAEFLDEENSIYYFVYDIGTIENVPLYTIMDLGNTQGITIESEETVTEQVSEQMAKSVANAVSEATTNTSTWTLANNWNQQSGVSNEHRTETSEEYVSAFERAFTASDNYSVGSGWGIDSAYSTTDGSSAKISHSNKQAVSREDSETLSAKASVSIEVKEPGVKAGASVEASDSITSKVGVSQEESTGTEYGSTHSDTSSTSSNWNINHGYSKSASESSKSSSQHKVAQAAMDSFKYDFTSSVGGSETTGQQVSTNETNSRTSTSSFTYGKTATTSQKLKISNAGAPAGYYRLVAAGTLHVFAVVGYDLATNTFFTTTYSAMDDNDEIHKFIDYSAVTPNFNDNQNGVLPFEVPRYVGEKVRLIVAASDGLVIAPKTGHIVAYEGSDTDVVIPQFMAIDNGNDTYSAIKVTGIEASAFAGNTAIESVLFSDTITEIPDGAFAGCTNLKAIYSSNITKIGAEAFSGCTSLLGFAVPTSVTELGTGAFSGTTCPVKVRAANAAVADAALASGAKNLTVSLNAFDTADFSDREINIAADTTYFELQGSGNYSGLVINSDAQTTVLNGITFVNIVKTPLTLSSENVRLVNTNILGAPGYAMILKAASTNLSLQGEMDITTSGSKAILSRSMSLSRLNSSVWSALYVTGNVYVCGTVTNNSLISFNNDGNGWQIIYIDDQNFEKMISHNVVTFDGNEGTPEYPTKEVENGEVLGALPGAERAGYNFLGWFTDPVEGETVSEENLIADDVTYYAHWEPFVYSVSWSTGTGYSISVERTESPIIGAEIGALGNGSSIYLGDVLHIDYAAANGYNLGDCGESDITVEGNIGSDRIYASATPNSVTYNIIYRSSNGTNLGSTTATYDIGTTHTISAPGKDGYNTPSSQTVAWDSLTPKTITFTYSPTGVGTQSIRGNSWWWQSGSNGITYRVEVSYSNRTANSVTATVHWYQSITTNTYYGFYQKYYVSMGNGNTGWRTICNTSTWAKGFTGSRDRSDSVSFTISGLSATQTSVNYYVETQAQSSADHPAAFSGSVRIPAY